MLANSIFPAAQTSLRGSLRLGKIPVARIKHKNMAKTRILDASGRPLGAIGDDNKVYAEGIADPIGTVENDREVRDKHYTKIGYFTTEGYVYEGTTHIGTVKNTGYVVDYNDHTVGKVEGGHIFSGGAALLLLLL